MTTSCHHKIIDASECTNGMKILCIGRICLDIIQMCKQFPLEDSTERSIDYRWQRGGNASNSCTVLSLLGQRCELLACLSAEEHIDFLQNDLRKYKIDFSHCPMIKNIGCPIATIILSLSTGTRTIVYHNQKLPELTLKNFKLLNLEEYSWIHFEGRNVDEVLLMMQHIENYNNSLKNTHDHNIKNRMSITISVELESPRAGNRLLELLPCSDVIFVGKEYATSQGFRNMDEVMQAIGQDTKLKGALICAWAEEGAIARTPFGTIVQSPAFPPQKVVDTLGAGDTFNAAVLYYLNKRKVEFMHKCEREKICASEINQMNVGTFDSIVLNRDIKQNSDIKNLKFIDEAVLQETIKFACCLAGAKVGLRGYDHLDTIFNDILKS